MEHEDRSDNRSSLAAISAAGVAALFNLIPALLDGDPLFESLDRAGFMFAVTYLITWVFLNLSQSNPPDKTAKTQASFRDRARERGRAVLARLRPGLARNNARPRPDMQG